MSNKCRAYSRLTDGNEQPGFKAGFYAGWNSERCNIINFLEKTADKHVHAASKKNISPEDAEAQLAASAVLVKAANELRSFEAEWAKGLPKEPGRYWLYCYRYGKSSGAGPDNEPETLLAEAVTVGDGIMLCADGQFVSASEVEMPYFKPAILPTPPVGFDL